MKKVERTGNAVWVTYTENTPKPTAPPPARTPIPPPSEEEWPCLAAAMNILGYGEHTETALREKLLMRGFSPYEIGRAFLRLRKWRYLDERGFFLREVRRMALRRHYGIHRIKMELMKKKFSPAILSDDALWDEALEEVDFERLCEEKMRGYFRQHPLPDIGGLERWEGLEKLRDAFQRGASAMGRLGYTTGEIMKAIERIREDPEGTGMNGDLETGSDHGNERNNG